MEEEEEEEEVDPEAGNVVERSISVTDICKEGCSLMCPACNSTCKTSHTPEDPDELRFSSV